jgi:hypothetical protein
MTPPSVIEEEEDPMTKSMMRPVCKLQLVMLALAFAATAAVAQTDAQKAFTTLKSLPGIWEGNSPKGPVQVSFKVTAGGSAIMSEILGKEDMISMFNLDGPNRLLLTHYCAVGNQPRMQAETSADGKTITFTYLDATNLAAPDAGHMQKMVLTVLDANHHTEEWTFADHGKEHKAFFDLQRKASM